MVALNEAQQQALSAVEAVGERTETKVKALAQAIAQEKEDLYLVHMAQWEQDLEDAVIAAARAGVPKRQLLAMTGLSTEPYLIDRILARDGGYVRTGRM